MSNVKDFDAGAFEIAVDYDLGSITWFYGAPTDDVARLTARIADLEAANKVLNETLEELRKVLTPVPASALPRFDERSKSLLTMTDPLAFRLGGDSSR